MTLVRKAGSTGDIALHELWVKPGEENQLQVLKNFLKPEFGILAGVVAVLRWGHSCMFFEGGIEGGFGIEADIVSNIKYILILV